MDSPGPTTLFAACAEPILVTASATPLATNTVRAMVANNTMVRLIKRPPLCRGAKEERCQTPAALRNKVSMKRLRDLAQLPRIPIPRTPVNKGRGTEFFENSVPLVVRPSTATGGLLRSVLGCEAPASCAAL